MDANVVPLTDTQEATGLSPRYDADLRTGGRYRTSATKWRERSADELTERNEQVIQGGPVASREKLAQRLFTVVRRLGLDPTEAVADAMNMGIDADTGLTIGNGHHQIRRLSTDAGKSQQCFERPGHPAVMSIEQLPAEEPEVFRLVAIEGGGIDRLLDLSDGKRRHRLRCFGEAEETGGRRGGRGIPCAEADKTGNEDAKRIARLFGNDANHRHRIARDFLPNRGEDPRNPSRHVTRPTPNPIHWR